MSRPESPLTSGWEHLETPAAPRQTRKDVMLLLPLECTEQRLSAAHTGATFHQDQLPVRNFIFHLLGPSEVNQREGFPSQS